MIGETVIVILKALGFYVALLLSRSLRRSLIRCLGASAIGNLTSLVAGLATGYLVRLLR